MKKIKLNNNLPSSRGRPSLANLERKSVSKSSCISYTLRAFHCFFVQPWLKYKRPPRFSLTNRGVTKFIKATVANLPEMLRLEQAANHLPWSKQQLQDCLQANYDCWLITLDEVIIGQLILRFLLDEIEILNLAIHPDFQGQGYGRQLLAFACECGLQQQCQKIFLEVRVSNIKAKQLYLSQGFAVVAYRKTYYPSLTGTKEDAIIMAKDL